MALKIVATKEYKENGITIKVVNEAGKARRHGKWTNVSYTTAHWMEDPSVGQPFCNRWTGIPGQGIFTATLPCYNCEPELTIDFCGASAEKYCKAFNVSEKTLDNVIDVMEKALKDFKGYEPFHKN